MATFSRSWQPLIAPPCRRGVVHQCCGRYRCRRCLQYTPLLPDVVAVGVAVTAHDNGNADGGYAVISDLTATFPPITAPTTLTATSQPGNVTNYAGSEASFRFVYNNNSVPNVLIWPANITNQWYKNGVAIAGATGSAYTFLLTPGDDGAQISAKATILPPYNTTIQGLTSVDRRSEGAPGYRLQQRFEGGIFRRGNQDCGRSWKRWAGQLFTHGQF